jgi:hypothetical protein
MWTIFAVFFMWPVFIVFLRVCDQCSLFSSLCQQLSLYFMIFSWLNLNKLIWDHLLLMFPVFISSDYCYPDWIWRCYMDFNFSGRLRRRNDQCYGGIPFLLHKG